MIDEKIVGGRMCLECGALEGCCANAKDRLLTSNALEALVRRQSTIITDLKREIQEMRHVIDDLRRALEAG